MIEVVCASGFISDVDIFIRNLSEFSNEEDLVVQVFDATAIYSKDHLLSATIHARRAFQQGTNSTESLALEILLYAAGERQIEKAIRKIGVQKGTQQMVFLLTNTCSKKKITIDKTVKKRLLRKFELTPEKKTCKGNRETLKRFGITDRELSTIPKDCFGEIILEKVALVDIIKK